MIKIPDSVGVLPPKVLAAIAVIQALEIPVMELSELITYLANVYNIDSGMNYEGYISFDIYKYKVDDHA
ncbi:hypothetical protein [Pseudanabaena sp. BC1403]|uniref:hypothetical protein n=1 Tax=Pseudanabaena sp. BC1403 TaxID=2043171 RepID=UPI000CD8BAC4|nr:hypothetical protein [Pseudanabaena sp. BC1403]